MNRARWKHSYGITSRFSWTNFKKYEPNALGNIGLAVRTTIPGIGTGNPGTISSGCVVNKVSMI
jgi:hypothetical protein